MASTRHGHPAGRAGGRGVGRDHRAADVVSADTRRTERLNEQKAIEAQMEKGGEKYWATRRARDGQEDRRARRAEDTSVGARVRYKGVAMTVIEPADADGDLTLQEDFDSDGAIADRLRDVFDELLADIGADSAEQRASTSSPAFSSLFRKPAAARRADQPPRPARRHLARGLPAEVEAHAGGRLARRDFLTTVCTRHSPLANGWCTTRATTPTSRPSPSSRLDEYKKEYERQQKRLKELAHLGSHRRFGDSSRRTWRRCSARAARAANKEHRGNFGGADDAEDDVSQMSCSTRSLELNMHISFQAASIAMPILALDRRGLRLQGRPDPLHANVDFGLDMRLARRPRRPQRHGQVDAAQADARRASSPTDGGVSRHRALPHRRLQPALVRPARQRTWTSPRARS